MSDIVAVCPECDDTNIRRHTSPDAETEFHCGNCSARFDDPDQRERNAPRRSPGTLPTGLAPEMKQKIRELSDGG